MSLVFALFIVSSIILQNNVQVQCLPSKILGGNYVTDITKFNYQASLRELLPYGLNELCGASIIDRIHLLTAAHCVSKDLNTVKSVEYFEVRAGSVNLEDDSIITRKPSYFFVHENYKDGEGLVNDIAVVRLSSPFEWSNAIKPIALQLTTPTPNSTAWVSGWGTILSESDPNLLMYVEVSVVEMSSCNQSWKGILRPGHLCAGIDEKNSCRGDVGAPLVSLESGNLIGVVSLGVDCGIRGYPGLYQDVAYYNEWIVDQIDTSTGSSANFITPLSVLVLTFGTLLFRQI